MVPCGAMPVVRVGVSGKGAQGTEDPLGIWSPRCLVLCDLRPWGSWAPSPPTACLVLRVPVLELLPRRLEHL